MIEITDITVSLKPIQDADLVLAPSNPDGYKILKDRNPMPFQEMRYAVSELLERARGECSIVCISVHRAIDRK